MPHYGDYYTSDLYAQHSAKGSRVMMCHACGASVVGAQAQKDHNRFHDNMVSREEAKAMSAVLWCDNGNHAFKAGMPGSQSYAGTEIDADGNARTVKMDVCSEHTFQAMADTKAKAITATAVEAEELQDSAVPVAKFMPER